MNTLNLLAIAAWSLAVDGGSCELKVSESIEWCVHGTCSPVESVTAETPDRWVLAPSKIAIHWTSPDTAELECEGRAAVASVKREAGAGAPAPKVPRDQLEAVLGVDPGRVVPGMWVSGTRDCIEGTQAWVFSPLDPGRPKVFVAREAEAWVVSRARGGLALCKGGRYGGVSPER